MGHFLTVEEVARFLGMGIDDTSRLLGRSSLTAKMVAGVPRYQTEDIYRWMENLVGSSAVDRLREVDIAAARDSGFDPRGPFLSQMLTPGRVFADLPANTKPSLLRHLSRLACSTGVVYDEKGLLDLLEERERTASTAVMDRVAFPHPARMGELYTEADLLLLVRTSRPLPFGAPLGKLTSLFFLLLFRDPVAHIHVLARLAGLLRRGSLAEELVHAETVEDMAFLIETAEKGFIGAF
jgi:mannitol/fructose-specific phosphotransferase system IIA component (Ntr-type)